MKPLQPLQPKQTIYFNFENKCILKCMIDEINGTKIAFHKIKENRGAVYTARIFECDISEYGIKFALTKEELE